MASRSIAPLLVILGVVLIVPDPARAQLPSAFGVGGSAAKILSGPGAKIDSNIRALQAASRSALQVTGPGATVSGLSVESFAKIRGDGAMQVYVRLTAVTKRELAGLAAAGVVVEAAEPRWMKAVQAWLTPDQIDQVGALPFVLQVGLPAYAVSRTGSVTTQGDAVHQADQVRALGIDGTGKRVGVISDGVTNRAASQATGDLPDVIRINPAQPGSKDEGTAMLEIVHDLAPGASLAFSGPTTSIQMVDAILWLADHGIQKGDSDIIVDDLGFYGEPFFEDGAVAQAAAAAVGPYARVFISAGGNDAQEHHQRQYANVVVNNGATGGANWDLYDWDGGGDHSLDVVVPVRGGTPVTDGQLRIFLQWDDLFGGSANDYDLYAVNSAENAVITSSISTQNGTQNPYEAILLTNSSTTTPLSRRIWIRRFNTPTGPKTLELFTLPNRGGGGMQEHFSAADSIFGHPAVPGVVSVAAANHATSCTAEAFSSRGPSTLAFPAVTRQTPYATAVDGVQVTGVGGFGSPFFGTSAAAPHAAGIAALLASCKPAASPTQIGAALIVGATDCAPANFDNTYGNGTLKALAAVQSLGACDQATLSKDAANCQKAVGAGMLKFKKAKLKAWTKCLDQLLKGEACVAAGRDAAILAAKTKAADFIGKKCTQDLLFDLPPEGVGFEEDCEFESGPLEPAEQACAALPVGTPAELAECLSCWKEAELDEFLHILYPCPNPSPVPAGSALDCGTPPGSCPATNDDATLRCLSTIGKEGSKWFLEKEKRIERCLDNVRKGKLAPPCPDPKTATKLAEKAQKAKDKIAAKCAALPPWWDVCPEDSTPPCDQTIGSVTDLGVCVVGAAGEIVDELVCQQYPDADNHGIACPVGSASGAFLEG